MKIEKDGNLSVPNDVPNVSNIDNFGDDYKQEISQIDI